MLRTASQSARFMRMTSWSRVMPALLTRMSILPNCASAALKADLIWSSSATSMRESRGFPAAGGDLLHQFVQLLLIAGSDGDSRSGGCEFEGAGTANALGCAGDQRDPA